MTCSPISQSKLEAITRDLHEARENVRERVTIAFVFTFDWLRKWREFFLSQSLSMVMQSNQSKCESLSKVKWELLYIVFLRAKYPPDGCLIFFVSVAEGIGHTLTKTNCFILAYLNNWRFILFFCKIFRTFLSNMKAFGLENDICIEFLHKMSTIGELSQGKQDRGSLGRVAWNQGKPQFHAKLGAGRRHFEVMY